MWHPVLQSEQFVKDDMVRVSVGGVDALLIRNGVRFDAYHPICCHGGAPLEQGYQAGGCIICPWHRSTFNLDSGRVVAGPARHALKRIPCRHVHGSIELWLDDKTNNKVSTYSIKRQRDLATLRQIPGERFCIETEDGMRLWVRCPPSMRVNDIDILSEVFDEDLYRIEALASNADLVVDVGAQAGFFTLLCANLPHKPQVLAYEPQPENFGALIENIALNQHLNVHAYQLAVSDTEGAVEFFCSQWNTGGHSMITGDVREEVPSTTLQSIFKSHAIDRLPVLKMDCEGGEYSIIRSTPDVILERIDRIILEEHRFCGFEDLYPRDVIWNRLASVGFTVESIMNVEYPGEGAFRVLMATRA